MQAAERKNVRSLRYVVAAVLMSAGLVVAPVHGVAWADDTGSTSSTSAGPDAAGKPDPSDEPKDRSEPDTPDTDTPETGADKPGISLTEPRTAPKRAGSGAKLDRDRPLTTRRVERSVRTPRAVSSGATTAVLTIEAPALQPALTAQTAAPTVVGALASAVEVTTPTPPKPLSPIARALSCPVASSTPCCSSSTSPRARAAPVARSTSRRSTICCSLRSAKWSDWSGCTARRPCSQCCPP
ncbi:hypothetical protein [Mycobacterium sp. ITM-2016-00316]|uniref:hypothetical protein n=1 Tax=Mycobacterium sp. ITM-2016-00316 TaxID=2099695 RepID=UPI0037C9BE24